MRTFFKLMLIIFIVSIASFTARSNIKDNFRHSFQKKRPRSAASSLAVESKNRPPVKNFIIPKKKKRILGQRPPKIK